MAWLKAALVCSLEHEHVQKQTTSYLWDLVESCCNACRGLTRGVLQVAMRSCIQEGLACVCDEQPRMLWAEADHAAGVFCDLL